MSAFEQIQSTAEDAILELEAEIGDLAATKALSLARAVASHHEVCHA